jgi:hypothetical protein
MTPFEPDFFGWPGPPLRAGSLRLGSDDHGGVKIGRLLLLGFMAMILSAPATAAVSPERDGGVYANLSALASVVTELG